MSFAGFGAPASSAPSSSLSLNTGTSSAGGGLFGSTPATASSTTGLFGAAPASSQPQANSLFGAASQPASSGTSLFGQTAAATSQPAGSSLFGAAGAGAAKPASGGLFGNTSTTTQAGSGGLFGTAPAAAATSASPFGAAASAPQSNSLFPTSTPASAPPQNTSLFGAAQPKPAASTSLFGAPAQQNTPTLGSGFGAGLSASTQTVPGVKIDLGNVRGTTRFGDLHEDLQKLIEAIDKQILQEIEYHKQVEAFLPGHADQLEYIPNDVQFVGKRYETAMQSLDGDAQAVDAALKTNKQDAEDAKRIFAAQDRLKLPPQYHQQSLWESRNSLESGGTNYDLVSYFSGRVDELSSQLDTFKGSVSEIEGHLHGVEARTVQQLQQLMYDRGSGHVASSSEDQLRELSTVLRAFEEGILKVASNVGSAREGIQELVLSENVNGTRK